MLIFHDAIFGPLSLASIETYLYYNRGVVILLNFVLCLTVRQWE